ncbi:MAG TPA: zincin-like metallopeptidase domain-containing protein [Spirochaetia bacterium]|nr:zincin-like metallopeptidase domain-containing protein [Spirochaetia bacterium]
METDGSFKKSDLYERVTAEIIRAIEAGMEEYKMPWHQAASSGFPRNASTGNHYRGVNTVALWATSQIRGYGLPYWATFLQWEKLGARIRRGEKASVVVFYKREEAPKDDEDRESARGARVVLKASFVFNVEQVDGWSSPEPITYEDRTEKLQGVDGFIESLGADILYGGEGASYNMTLDRIRMPERCYFIGTDTSTPTEAFYSVLLHELVHWTGHPLRLHRDLSGRFGTSAYAVEELVAELGAAFLCADLGISLYPRGDHAAYVYSWLRVLREQKSAIFTAASSSTAVCRFLGELATAKTNRVVCSSS